MSRLVEAKRMIGLVVVLMAAMVALSGPVAQVLDLPEPVAEAKKKHKHKKKKKKNRPPAFNVVQCPTSGEFVCEGTVANDFLIGRSGGDGSDLMNGFEGNDVYNGGNGSDFLLDESTTSSDVYLFPSTPFSAGLGGLFAEVKDKGGSGDVVDLRSYSIAEFEVRRDGSPPQRGILFLDGPGDRDIDISDFFDGETFGVGKIETFLFSGGAHTADDIASRVIN